MLFVCIGNVCRSPLGERLLAARLGDERFDVSSAGVRAVVGSPMSPEAAEQLVDLGGSPDGFAARQLTDEMLRSSDLVLTATRELRSRVLEDVPGALRRTFTVREFAALLPDCQAETLPELVAAAAASRSRVRLDDYDIPDPFRRGPEAHALAAALMAEGIDVIAKHLGSM